MLKNGSSKVMFVGLALVTAALACSAPGGASSGTAVPDTTATTAPTAVDPTAACPAATDGTTQFISKENGYCFLYPSYMKSGAAFQPDTRSVSFFGEPLDPTSPEPVVAHIEVAYNGPSDVADSAAYGAKWYQVYGVQATAPTQIIVGGQSAAFIPDVPGMMAQQIALVVANGSKYTVMSSSIGLAPEGIRPQLETAWNTVTQSIVFFEPSDVLQVVRPEDVCKKSEADGDVEFIDWSGGVCMLYPASFDINAEFGQGRGWFEGGDFLGEIFSRPLKAELVIAYFGPAEGKTPRQLFEPRLVNQEVSQIDVAGAQDVTVGGYPAIVWTEGEPLGSRQAIVVANDRVYTIVNQPYNDPDFPGGTENVELIWQGVTTTVAFFTPWH